MFITAANPSALSYVNPNHDLTNNELPSLYDDMTLKLQSGVLPLEVQLMLEPMWVVRSKYNDCMRPLDFAMEQYMKFRNRLKEIDHQIELGIASNVDIATAFDKVFHLLNIYEKNQKALNGIMKEVNHQILSYAHASKNDLLWNEMLHLRELDYISFTRKTCTFEHAVTCLFKLDESLKESIRSSLEISKCCANYLLRIAQHFNFTKDLFPLGLMSSLPPNVKQDSPSTASEEKDENRKSKSYICEHPQLKAVPNTTCVSSVTELIESNIVVTHKTGEKTSLVMP